MLWILHLECDVFLSSLSVFPLNSKLRESGPGSVLSLAGLKQALSIYQVNK